jgi:hypothetical protein
MLAERQLKAETARNREREDELVSRIATSHGVFGVPARTRPAYQPQRATAPQGSQPDLSNLSRAEQEEFSLWLRNAAENGVEANQAARDFLNDLMLRRRPISDGEM